MSSSRRLAGDGSSAARTAANASGARWWLGGHPSACGLPGRSPWSFDPDLLTELDVRFIADSTGTRVELEHRLDGYGADAEQMFQIFDSPEGWGGLLDRFAREAG
jgi:hypothetical protein